MEKKLEEGLYPLKGYEELRKTETRKNVMYFLKLILYIELILFFGWGCVAAWQNYCDRIAKVKEENIDIGKISEVPQIAFERETIKSLQDLNTQLSKEFHEIQKKLELQRIIKNKLEELETSNKQGIQSTSSPLEINIATTELSESRIDTTQNSISEPEENNSEFKSTQSEESASESQQEFPESNSESLDNGPEDSTEKEFLGLNFPLLWSSGFIFHVNEGGQTTENPISEEDLKESSETEESESSISTFAPTSIVPGLVEKQSYEKLSENDELLDHDHSDPESDDDDLISLSDYYDQLSSSETILKGIPIHSFHFKLSHVSDSGSSEHEITESSESLTEQENEESKKSSSEETDNHKTSSESFSRIPKYEDDSTKESSSGNSEEYRKRYSDESMKQSSNEYVDTLVTEEVSEDNPKDKTFTVEMTESSSTLLNEKPEVHETEETLKEEKQEEVMEENQETVVEGNQETVMKESEETTVEEKHDQDKSLTDEITEEESSSATNSKESSYNLEESIRRQQLMRIYMSYGRPHFNLALARFS